MDAFLELQQLRLVAPRYPGLTKLLTKAARAAAGSRQCSNGNSMHRVSLDAAVCLRRSAVSLLFARVCHIRRVDLYACPHFWLIAAEPVFVMEV